MENGNKKIFYDRKMPVHYPFIEKHNRLNLIFLTVCTKDKKKILSRSDVLNILVDSWMNSREWVVGKFMIMPDHIHLFCAPKVHSHPSLKLWIKYWKSDVSKKWMFENEKPIWQRDFWDRQLRDDEHYSRKWEYVSNNPVRQRLVKDVKDWPFQGELNIFRWT